MAGDLVPKIELSNGTMIPQLGLGTWKSEPKAVYEAVKAAIELGYRHIDCAFAYQNEAEVGAAIREKIEEGVVTRDDLFVVSKLWNTFHSPDLVEPAIRKSLELFGLDYLDLYLIHFPVGFQEDDEDNLMPLDENGKAIESGVDYVDTYKAMEELVEKGLAKGVGISNFNKGQVERVLDGCTIPPVSIQIEVHPYLNNAKLIEFCKSKDIVVTAYSPFASPDSPWRKPGDPILLEDPVLKLIAEERGKTVAQIVLRWIVEKGLVVIPKSVNKDRLAQNIAVFDFELTEADVETIDELNRNFRAVRISPADNHVHYPFHDDGEESDED